MFNDHFSEIHVYSPELFRHCYRMNCGLFLRIIERVCTYDDYFVQMVDATRNLGLSSIQKCTPALQMLAYRVSSDATDEYCRIAENMAIDCMEAMKHYILAVCAKFAVQSLQQFTDVDIVRQMHINKA